MNFKKILRKNLITFSVMTLLAGVLTTINSSFNVEKALADDSYEITFDYTGTPQEWTVPEDGYYQLEVWGAQGTGYASPGGKGGYSKGSISLEKNQKIYIYVGGTSGFNGGGSGTLEQNISRNGGGGTDIRINGNNFENRIIVAGGGGGAGYCYPGDGCTTLVGGYGGGLTGGDSTGSYAAYGATQTSGGIGARGVATNGSFGLGGNARNYNGSFIGGGGGGGYYGGGGADGNTTGFSSAGGGGSGYIGGVINGEMASGIEEMPNPFGGTEVGHKSNGYARISIGSTSNNSENDFSINELSKTTLTGSGALGATFLSTKTDNHFIAKNFYYSPSSRWEFGPVDNEGVLGANTYIESATNSFGTHNKFNQIPNSNWIINLTGSTYRGAVQARLFDNDGNFIKMINFGRSYYAISGNGKYILTMNDYGTGTSGQKGKLNLYLVTDNNIQKISETTETYSVDWTKFAFSGDLSYVVINDSLRQNIKILPLDSNMNFIENNKVETGIRLETKFSYSMNNNVLFVLNGAYGTSFNSYKIDYFNGNVTETLLGSYSETVNDFSISPDKKHVFTVDSIHKELNVYKIGNDNRLKLINIFNIEDGSYYPMAINYSLDGKYFLIGFSSTPASTGRYKSLKIYSTDPILSPDNSDLNEIPIRTITVNNSKAKLSWIDSNTDLANGYKVEIYDENKDLIDTRVVNAEDNNLIVNNLTSNKEYGFKLFRINDDFTEEQLILTGLETEPKLQDFTISQIDGKNSNITWGLDNDGNNPINKISVKIDNQDPIDYTITDETSINSEFSLGNHTVELIASNSVGESKKLTKAFTMEETPGKVTNLTYTKTGKNITISWDKPDNVSSSEGITYKIESFPAGYKILSTSDTSVTFTNIPDGRNYQFGITASSFLGIGETTYTEPIDFYNENVPAPEWNYHISNAGQVQLGWRIPIDSNLTVTNYILECSDLDNPTYSKAWTLSASVTDYNPQFDKLGLGDHYTCTVRVKNADGIGKASEATPEVIPYKVPDRVSNPQIVEGNKALTLNWTAPYNNGSEITNYIINYTNQKTGDSFNTTVLSGTSKTFENLTNGDSYRFLIYAINAAGTSQGYTLIGVPRTNPGPARDTVFVASEPGTARATASWKAPINNGGSSVTYRVRLFNVTTDQYILDRNANQTEMAFSNLTWDNVYKIFVISKNAAGETTTPNESNEITILNLPEKPGNVEAVAGIESATITWTTPVSNGATITGYRVSGSGKIIDVDSSKNSVEIDGLSPSQKVRFTVTVLSDRGQGRSETTAEPGITIVGYPYAPRIGNIVAKDYSLNVSYSRSLSNSGDGNSPVTGYELTLFDTTDNTQEQPITTDLTSHQFTGLTPGHDYKVGVKVINVVGMSPQSLTKIVTPYGIPDPVTNVIAKKLNDYSVNVSFTSGLNNYDVARYRIDAINIVTGEIDLTKTVSTNSAIFTNFPNSSIYKFKITAVNRAGESTSVESNQVIVDAITSESNILGDSSWAETISATAGVRSATVQYSPVENVTNYYITVIDHTNPVNGGQVIKTDKTEVSINNLTPLDEYSFKVIGVNETSSTYEIESNKVTPMSYPDIPTDLSISSDNSNSIEVNWSAPNSYNSPILSYTVKATTIESGSNSGKTVSKAFDGNTTSGRIDGLTAGKHYVFRVMATNEYGSSKWSDESDSILTFGIPENVEYAEVASQNGLIKVSWSKPNNADQAGINSYVVISNTGEEQTVTSTQALFTDLNIGDSYNFTIKAVNQYGESSGVITKDALFLVAPDTPGIPIATPSNGSAYISISPSIETGGEPIDHYKVTSINLDNSESPKTVNAYNGYAVVNGLTNGDRYSFVVTAVNSVGESLPSESSNIVIPLSGPIAKVSENSSKKLTVDWTGSFETGNDYTVILKDLTDDTSQEFQVVNDTYFTTNNDLNLGHYYSFTIDNGIDEKTSNVVMPYGEPNPVSNVVAATNELGTLTVTWDPSPNLNGKNLKYYRIQLYKEMGNVLVDSYEGVGSINRKVTFDILADNYYAKVSAVNDAGYSDPVNSNTVTVYSTPTAPRMASIIPNDGFVTVNWLAPLNSGGVDLIDYTVRLTDQTTGSEITQWNSNDVSGYEFSHVFNQLENGHKYTFSVMTSNEFGDSDWSQESYYVITNASYSEELPPASLDLGNPDDTGMVNVYIESEITLTLSDDSVTLNEIPDMATTETDNEMVYNVKTNSIAGFNVTLNSDSDTLSPSIVGNNEGFDFSDVKAWNSEASSDDAISLSTDPGLIQSSDTKTSNNGQDFTTKFSANIPWINADTYTGTVTYTATAK